MNLNGPTAVNLVRLLITLISNLLTMNTKRIETSGAKTFLTELCVIPSMNDRIARAYHLLTRQFRGTKLEENGYVSKAHNLLSNKLNKQVDNSDIGPQWINYENSKLYVNPQDFIGRSLYVRGEYEPETAQIIRDLLSEGDTAIDVGAHIGHHSLSMRQSVGDSGIVFPIEPHPENAKNIRRTINRNGWQNVELVETALGKDRATRKLLENPGNTGGSTLQTRPLSEYPQIKSEGSEFEVESRPLSNFLVEYSIDSVDLLKIDIEGGEFDVLTDIEEHLEKISTILIETHTHKLDTYEISEIYNILTNRGDVKIVPSMESATKQDIGHGTQLLWTNSCR